MSKSKKVKAVFDAFVMDSNGAPSSSHSRWVQVYPPDGCVDWGWSRFLERSILESDCLADGWFTIICGVIVVRDPIDLPPSNIGSHLGLLLDSTDGSDVSFAVDGEKFPAHRAVLAARSPVFKAQLLGSMADAKMSSMTMQDIAPATFRAMLRFIYTDACPADAGESPSDMFQNLLAAADRFALDRLKVLCARKLRDNVSVETVADTLLHCLPLLQQSHARTQRAQETVQQRSLVGVLGSRSLVSSCLAQNGSGPCNCRMRATIVSG
ncbi:hypothetical protein BS78_07G197000 [Paspalum vaginatum]|nr:hypothetical protein BS78_07G197000 [Paspalum vaginatum]